jgi:hypothetical protein
VTGRSGRVWPARRTRSRWTRRRKLAGLAPSPFALLGLDPAAGLTDDDVLAAWRRIAAATHPDRPDGGDAAGFAAAAAAYTDLRTQSGRGEARAALAERAGAGMRGGRAAGGPWPGGAAGGQRPGGVAGSHWPGGVAGGYLGRRILVRIRLGRPVRLTLRVLGAAGAAAAGSLAAGPGPAGPALQIGALTWLVLTVRRDLYRP